ncbi:MAG TPA: TonB-dependent receptor, partial [Verrucomicrobiales bacterium]|nr:TonB-dependent receptor [Verrucomicrobiales bacterium]
QVIDVPLRGSVGGRYSSADEGAGGDILLEGGAGGFAWHLEGSRRDQDDLRIPGFARSARLRRLDPGVPDVRDALPNSFMHTSGFSGGASYIWDQGYFGAAVSGFDARYGSPAEEEVSIDLRQRRWDFQGAFQQPVSGIKSIKYRFALSDYEHTEFEGAEAGTIFKNEGFDGRVEVQHAKAGPFEGAFGFQTERSDFSALGEEAFLPETLTHSSSGFLFEEAALTDALKLQGGARYDRVSADAESDSRFGPARNRSFDNLSGSLGILYSPGEDWVVALSAAYSQRAPTSQELYANGPHLATGTFEVGDDGLNSEKALGFDLSLRKRTGRLTGSVTGFYTRFHDFIGQFPNGTREDDLPVYSYRSTGAEFAGIEAEAVIHLLEPLSAPASQSGKETSPGDSSGGNRLDLELKADYVRARDTRTGDPLPRIPPFHASAALDYHRGPFGARLEGVYAGDQHRVADNELPTDGYFMLNAALTYTFKAGSTTTDVFIKGVNLTDEEAREHTSFLKDIAPLGGRGVVAGVKIRF